MPNASWEVDFHSSFLNVGRGCLGFWPATCNHLGYRNMLGYLTELNKALAYIDWLIRILSFVWTARWRRSHGEPGKFLSITDVLPQSWGCPSSQIRDVLIDPTLQYCHLGSSGRHDRLVIQSSAPLSQEFGVKYCCHSSTPFLILSLL